MAAVVTWQKALPEGDVNGKLGEYNYFKRKHLFMRPYLSSETNYTCKFNVTMNSHSNLLFSLFQLSNDLFLH